jgi:uncharacterized protein YbjT (DUF2867 family)
MARILVLGGTGFIGRHAAAALRDRGHEVAIGTRDPARAARRLPNTLRGCELVEAHLEWLTVPSEWARRLKGRDIVINAVGILRQRGWETYDRVHHLAPAALAQACARLGVRLIHVSALGLSLEATSRFILSKAKGEAAVARSSADYLIVRPSLLDGEGGYGARWLRRVARWPVHFVPSDAAGRIAALHVQDLGEAIASLCEERVGLASRVIELGGTDHRTIAETLAALRALTHSEPATVIKVPADLALLGAVLCDLAHFSPFSFGHLELMRHDNVPRENMLVALLGRLPRLIGRNPALSRPRPDLSGLRDAAGPAS